MADTIRAFLALQLLKVPVIGYFWLWAVLDGFSVGAKLLVLVGIPVLVFIVLVCVWWVWLWNSAEW